MEIVLLILILAAAIFLSVSIMFQKSKEDGLSSTITGGNAETYYGKDQAGRREKRLRKITLIISIFFVVAVLLVYFLQPDYIAMKGAGGWKELSSFAEYFKQS